MSTAILFGLVGFVGGLVASRTSTFSSISDILYTKAKCVKDKFVK